MIVENTEAQIKNGSPNIANAMLGDGTVSLGLSHGSLFSGIGGFELGAEWAGIPTKWNCDIK